MVATPNDSTRSLHPTEHSARAGTLFRSARDTPTLWTIYIFELKFNKSAREAMEQIDIKNYPERFAQYNLPITIVALNFDSESRNISEWIVK